MKNILIVNFHIYVSSNYNNLYYKNLVLVEN